MRFRWVTVFLDFSADTFSTGVAFWQEVTGCGLSSFRGPTADFATLLPPSGDPYLRVQRLASGSGGWHLDLHTADGSLEEAADRAVELGARVRHREAGELIVLDSPGGFTFCVVPWDGERAVAPPLTAGEAGEVSRLDTLCLDIPPARFDGEYAFWSALTGWEERDTPEPEFTILKGPPGLPARLLFQRLDDAEPGQRVRGHADVGATDVAAEVARHTGLGARVTATFPFWTVLADPAGREYCVVVRRSGGGA